MTSEYAVRIALQVLGALSGSVFGVAVYLYWEQGRASRMRREETRRLALGSAEEGLVWASTGIAMHVLDYAAGVQRRIDLGALRPLSTGISVPSTLEERLLRDVRYAGAEETIRRDGAREVTFRLSIAALACGALVGAFLSLELSFACGIIGLAAGLNAVPWALKREKTARSNALEQELPEMLEVLALGLRSGLSFERCLKLYGRHFKTPLARAWAQAQHQWEIGLKDRDQALREMAKTYDSQLLSRVVDTVVRSLHSGLSVAQSLQQVAGETRAVVKARREEQVAKAPVKMMLPMGTLMLPAMLLLVLGPVLLQLLNGF